MYRQAAAHLIKRAIQNGDDSVEFVVPKWTWAVLVADLVVFVPLCLIVFYTLSTLYPVFAIIEDENPPAYEPVALDDTNDSDPNSTTKPTDGRSETVSSSVRSINRVLRTQGGWRGNFRGLGIFLTQQVFAVFLLGIFSAILGDFFTPVATLMASLTLVPYSTAWVHISISHKSPLPFWRRVPKFKHTFDATWKAVVIYWAATELQRWLPNILAAILDVDLSLPKLTPGGELTVPDDQNDGAMFWKIWVIAGVTILYSIFGVIPAYVILIRVQASLLPVDEDAIVPFDRSFQGTITPAVAGGLGYATVTDAWATFSKGSWRRLVILYVKLYLVRIALISAMVAVVVPEMFAIIHATKRV